MAGLRVWGLFYIGLRVWGLFHIGQAVRGESCRRDWDFGAFPIHIGEVSEASLAGDTVTLVHFPYTTGCLRQSSPARLGSEAFPI